jgi:hypothetical protein
MGSPMARSTAPLLTVLLVVLLVAALGPPAGAVTPDAGVATAETCLSAGPDDPVGVGACPGVRPGAALRTDIASCTFNYVVTGAPTQGPTRTFIGTAAHCVMAEPGDRRWGPGAGPVARDGAGNEIGRVVYAHLSDSGDYALIEPHAGVAVDPRMCHFSGPTGIAPPSNESNGLVQHSGQGLGFGSVVPGRSHLARRLDDPREVRFDGPASFGDSGAPVGRNGAAVGVLVSIAANPSGAVRAWRLGPQLARAGQLLGLRMALVTA